jgi:hemerythrin-like domain-containing protein
MTTFDEPLESLQVCHQRIEAQLRALEELARAPSTRVPDPARSAAAAAVLRYFETSGAYHHQDEDDDLFPLLRVRAGALGRAEVAAGIDELEREHATLEAQWRRLREPLRALAELKAGLDAEEAARFAWLYRRHMDRETLLVPPFARETLAAPELARLGERMAARRAAK